MGCPVARLLPGLQVCLHGARGNKMVGYTDTVPFPATPVKWTYRAIYRVGDAQVGIWSAPVSITVPA